MLLGAESDYVLVHNAWQWAAFQLNPPQINKLGEGAFGHVWLAERRSNHARVAIKIIRTC